MRQAGLYVRISKDLRDGAGVERQREDGTRLVEQRGWGLHRVYCDNDISAAGHRRRPDYQQLLADLDSGVIDAVASRSFERLCKTRREQLTFVELGQEKRAPVAFTHAPDLDLTSAVGRGIADMMAAWARVEMEQKSERHIDQIAQAARHGLMVGGRRAFGYSPSGLELDPVEAPLVKEAYERWLTGESLTGIAMWLNSIGARTGQGNPWRRNSLREVLANPRNAALRGMRDVVNAKTGTRSQWHRIVGPAVWPPIVSEATWRAAMAKIKDPERDGNHRGIYPSAHLLSGIAECGRCGKSLVGSRADGRRVLMCAPVRHLCRGSERIEAWVEQRVIDHFSTPEGRRMLAATRERGSTVDVDTIRSEIIEKRARLDGLARDYKDGVLDRDQVKLVGGELRAEIADREMRIAAAGQVDVVSGLLGAVDVEAEWQSYPMGRQREILRRVMRIVVLPGTPGRPGGQWFAPSTVAVTWTPHR